MDRLMATAAPAGAFGKEGPARALMGKVSDGETGTHILLLKMTFQTQVLVTGNEHFLVYAAMRVMAGGAAFTHRFVFENKRSLLRGMTLGAGLIG